MSSNKLLNLGTYGRLLIFTDIHGNLEDYYKCISKWDMDDPDCHCVIAGDIIHSYDRNNDQSVDILDDVLIKANNFPNFHILLGNHEWVHIADFKPNSRIGNHIKNVTNHFNSLILKKHNTLEPYLSDYINFLKNCPYCVKTDNGIFISHAGPALSIKNQNDFNKFINNSNIFNDELNGFLKARPNFYKNSRITYSEEDVDQFLNAIGSNVMVVGHTRIPEEGYKLFGNQLIITSSYSDNCSYLDIDLSAEINDIEDLINFLKFI